MSAKIARGSASRNKSRSKASRGGSPRKAPQARIVDTLPLPAATVRRIGGWLFGATLLAIGLGALTAFGIPQKAGVELGEAVGRAGFTVRNIEPKGLNRMSPMLVYQVAEHQLNRAMPLVDLDATRDELLRFGWVKDARVSRRLPDTLVVDIVERTPSAIWQHNQKLILIDREGVVLEPVKFEAMPDLPLVIGPAANQHAQELDRLLQAAPQLKPIMAGAAWVGGRRWDLRFHSGEVLALPEGEAKARKALVRFGEMDRKSQLLGRGLVRFDMRVPGKMIVRVSREPGSTVPVVDDSAPVNERGATTTSQTI